MDSDCVLCEVQTQVLFVK